ncbi:MAG TPA: hypothetical protein VM940_02365 [Chthoniobacterales bacterium]|jgi:hypothetical protein|nr:hypothetical protein [Chthoniobacterales bacterium]
MIAVGLFDHPAVLILIALVGLVRWLVQKAREGQQNVPPPPPTAPIQRGGEANTEEERIRRFLEALGQPKGTPPPKVAPRPRPARPQVFPSPLPPLTTAPPPLPKSVTAARPPPPPPPLPATEPRFTPATAPGATFEIEEIAKPDASGPADETRRPLPAAAGQLKARFGSIQNVRDAIVLREIFGPPRSLQSFDLTNV